MITREERDRLREVCTEATPTLTGEALAGLPLAHRVAYNASLSVLSLLDALDAAEARALDAAFLAESYRDVVVEWRPIVQAAREFVACAVHYRECPEPEIADGWRRRVVALESLLAAVAASPTTERTPS